MAVREATARSMPGGATDVSAATLDAREREALERLLADVDAARDELATLLASLVRLPTVNYGDGHPGRDGIPNGNETPCAEVLRARLAEDGITAAIHESAPARGNLIARLPRASRPPSGPLRPPSLLLMSHLDVVPVEDPERWPYAPFGGVIAEGRVFGRGSQDAKSLAACEVLVMQLLRRRGVALKGDLALLAAADEESGGRFGAGWVVAQPELAAQVRAEVALNEGGGAAVHAPRGLGYLFATGEKGRLEVRIRIDGKPGHASAPWRAENALERAGIVLERLRTYQPVVDTSHPLFTELPPLFELPAPLTPETLPQAIERLEHSHRALGGSLRAASRLTLVPTMLHAGVKSNSIPGSCTIVCDARTLPHQDASYVERELRRLLHDLPWAHVAVETTAIANASPYDHPFRAVCGQALQLALGREDARLLPSLCGGFTDSRFFRPLGVQVYDFMPLHPEAEADDVGVHGTNERIEIDGLVARARFLMAAACLYLGIA
jgi:acetylornithine deacetylase/succinyl-diaminopimelate desuccinylase-like protein